MADEEYMTSLTSDDEQARRLCALAIAFSNAESPISSQEVHAAHYAELSDDSFRRKFSRDREKLVECGLVIRQVGLDARDALWQADVSSFADGSSLSADDALMLDVLCTQLVEDPAFAWRDELRLALAKVDHAFGAAEFDEVHMSHRDLPEFAAQSDAAWRANFIKVAFSKKGTFEMNEPYAGEFIDVTDGEEFDLGGLTVRCYAVPGHTPGCIVPVLVEERTAIFGDAAGPGTLVTEEYAPKLSEYLAALRKLKANEDAWDRVLRFHGTCESPKSLLDDMIEICEQVIAGADDHIAQPANAGDVYPIKSDLPIYLAKETLPGSQQRVDGREGNLFYRADKAC